MDKKIEEIIKAQNNQENVKFAQSLNTFNNNRNKAITEKHMINVCSTPLSLSICGAKDYNVMISPSYLKKLYTRHNLTDDLILKLADELRCPAFLLHGSATNPDAIVAISSIEHGVGQPLLIAVSLDKNEERHVINKISSYYGRKNFYPFINQQTGVVEKGYFNRQIEEGKLIAVNKEKARLMLQSNRLQLPQEGTYIGFDNSISYSLDSVKGLDEKFLEHLKENLSARYSKEVKTVDENKISSIIKESVTEATAPIVEKVNGVAEKIEILANRVNEQDALITQLVEDNDNKSQIITEQRGIIDEQQATIDELRKELEKALTENKQLKDEKALANDVLKSVSDKLLLAVPQFEHKDYASQYAEMGELLSEVEFIPADKVHEQKVENAVLKDELTDTKQTLSDIQAELKTVKNENSTLRQEIDRLVSRAEKVMTATIDEPEKAEDTDRGNDTPGKEGKSDIDIFER